MKKILLIALLFTLNVSFGQTPKIYEALLSSGQSVQNSGELVVGREYYVVKYFSGDDITNVGGQNSPNVRFTATATTPTNWTHFTEIMDVVNGAPVVTVLVNTIGNIVWEYHSDGNYKGYLQGAFPLEGTITIPFGMQYICAGYIDGNHNDKEAYRVIRESDDKILVQTYRDEKFKDEIIYYAPIIIKVYY